MSKTSTDPIADMLTRIRNAVQVNHAQVEVPYSKVKESIAQLLKQNGFIDDVRVSGELIDKTITLVINAQSENSRITEVVRLSKPGRRQYARTQNIPIVKRGRGVVIISTSRGMLTGKEAKKLGVGGELICKIY